MRVVLEMDSREVGRSGESDVIEPQRIGKRRSGKIDVALELRAGEIADAFEHRSAEACFSPELRVPERYLALKLSASKIGILKNLIIETCERRIGCSSTHNRSMLPNASASRRRSAGLPVRQQARERDRVNRDAAGRHEVIFRAEGRSRFRQKVAFSQLTLDQ